MYLARFLYITCHNVQVLTRYLLQKLFGPGVVGLTNNENILYLDLPSNMVSLSLPPPSLSTSAHTKHFYGCTRKKCMWRNAHLTFSGACFDVILHLLFSYHQKNHQQSLDFSCNFEVVVTFGSICVAILLHRFELCMIVGWWYGWGITHCWTHLSPIMW